MATAKIEFAGWFQCRLATDPDVYRDPRGEEGWTFALPGEPDLDRIIRFQDPVSPRTHAPAIGVKVTRVVLDGAAQAGHSLLEAPVVLADNAVFEGRNGAIATSANEPVVPFRMVISQGDIRVEGFDPMNLTSPQEIARRKPVNFVQVSEVALEALGVVDAAAYRAARLAQVEADLQTVVDPTERAGLILRRRELQSTSTALDSLAFQLTYRFDLRGPSSLADPAGTLALGANPAVLPWRVDYWMGAWDADALAGFIKGSLAIG